MDDLEQLPDVALVVRGGMIQGSILKIRSVAHEGAFGFSVQSASNKSIQELVAAGNIKNGRIGVTTVGAIRAAGFDVVVTRGGGFHATVNVPPDWSEAEATVLAALFNDIANPNRS